MKDISQIKIIIVTPWFGKFAGGAEVLAKSLAQEFNQRGIVTLVFTTCCKSPYSNWWKNDYEEGVSDVYGIETHRFLVDNRQKDYEKAVYKLIHDKENMSATEQLDFFTAGINSTDLVEALAPYLKDGYEVIAMPYFQGLSHSVINTYSNKISITPCFHDEDAFYWEPIEELLKNSKHIFYNTAEEKKLTIKNYGQIIGKKIIESPVAGIGVELKEDRQKEVLIENIPERFFVYVGRKEKGKNVHRLVEWFIEYKHLTKSPSKLLFLGGGDNSLIAKSDHLIDLGFVNESDKQWILQKALGLINLSENESFSIVLMEAWLNKIPAIVNGHCHVTTGHAQRANAGLYPSNKDEFIASLDYIETHEEEREILGKNGCYYVQENYSHDSVLKKYLDVMLSE